jgi:hypothetical protein
MTHRHQSPPDLPVVKRRVRLRRAYEFNADHYFGDGETQYDYPLIDPGEYTIKEFYDTLAKYGNNTLRVHSWHSPCDPGEHRISLRTSRPLTVAEKEALAERARARRDGQRENARKKIAELRELYPDLFNE